MNKRPLELYVQPQAEADMCDIADFIARDNPPAAKKLIATFYEKAEFLTHFPDVGQSRHEVSEGLRHFPVGRYLILYRTMPHTLEVVRVLHSARRA